MPSLLSSFNCFHKEPGPLSPIDPRCILAEPASVSRQSCRARRKGTQLAPQECQNAAPALVHSLPCWTQANLAVTWTSPPGAPQGPGFCKPQQHGSSTAFQSPRAPCKPLHGRAETARGHSRGCTRANKAKSGLKLTRMPFSNQNASGHSGGNTTQSPLCG